MKIITRYALFLTMLLCFFSNSDAKEKPNSYDPTFCKQYTYKKLIVPGKKVKKVFFVPDEDIKILILGLIHSTQPKTRLRIAVYQLTDKDIVDALILAHKRGVLIEIITDKSALYNRYERVSELRALGIPIHVYGGKYYSIMHNKFFVFEHTLGGKTIVVTGSANATIGGTTRNEENICIMENKMIVDQYRKKFDALKQQIALMPMPRTSSPLQVPKTMYKRMLKTFDSLINVIFQV